MVQNTGRSPVELFPQFVADEVDHAAHPEPAGGVVDEEELHTAHTSDIGGAHLGTADRVITGCIAPLRFGRSPAAIRDPGPIGISSDLADSANAWASRHLHLPPIAPELVFLTRISAPVLRPSGSGEFEAELASVPPGDGGVNGEVGVAEDG